MVSSLARFRHLLKREPSDEAKACVYHEFPIDTTRDEKFPIFCRDLYFSVFPPPDNARNKRIDDSRETDPAEFMKFQKHLGTSRLGKCYTAQRIDLTPYSCTVVAKTDPKLVVAVTKMDVKRVDYIDAVRAIEPFLLAGPDVSPFLGKILLSFRTSQPHLVENYYFVSEYSHASVPLCRRLQQVGPMKEDDVRFYITELIDAVAYVHKHGKIFRRLCMCNLMIDPIGHLKVVPYIMCDQNLDCGQACNMLVNNCGDQFYASPEVVFGVDVQFMTDWWSVGVIMYQLLTGELPFTGRTLGDLGKAITECPVISPECLSGEVIAFLKNILHKDPRRRLGFSEVGSIGEPGANEVRDHPFFQHVIWRFVTSRMMSPPFVPTESPPTIGDLFKEKMKLTGAASKGPRKTNC